MQIVRAEGDLNGGRFTASGSTGLSTTGFNDASVQLKADGVQLEYPKAFERNQQPIGANGSGSNLELTGTVDIVNALYNQDMTCPRKLMRVS